MDINQTDIGVYGLGVMGRNLALNLEQNGYSVSVYNRREKGEEMIVREFVEAAGEEKQFLGAESVAKFMNSIERPRKIILMIKAGPPVDQVIKELLPLLEAGDVLIDGGNSHFADTGRRVKHLKTKGINFIGMGISGGEEGARHGASLMPGGDADAWGVLKPILQSIAAETPQGDPCCSWMGKNGSGHFVKMVHNGIEYADMQLIAESYHIMTGGLGFGPVQAADVFHTWNRGPLNSYLLEITSSILTTRDDDGIPLIDKILDSAGQKGTGRWTVEAALDLGVPVPVIAASVFSRYLSAQISIREQGAKEISGPSANIPGDPQGVLERLQQALLTARIMVLAEGFNLIQEANRTFEWDMDPATVARIWQGGCIIRSKLLEPVEEAYRNQPDLNYLAFSENMKTILNDNEDTLRETVTAAVRAGLPVPGFSAAVTHYDGLRTERLPANLIQAQRDYFGAHRYERTDKPRGELFHTEWNKQAER